MRLNMASPNGMGIVGGEYRFLPFFLFMRQMTMTCTEASLYQDENVSLPEGTLETFISSRRI